MTGHDDYFAYLRRRSAIGFLYRRAWLYPRLVRHLHGRVLDVGCGIGDFLRFRPDTVGVDVNPVTVDWCRARGLDARVMAPDQLPFGAGEFDGVVLDNVLEHIAAPEPLLAEIRRVLAPRGALVVGVPGERGYASDPDHKVFYDRAALVSCMADAGFQMRRVMHLPLQSAWLSRHVSQYCIYGVFTRG